MRIVVALIIFSLIIIFHELGHFLLAKWNHIVVTEFSLGMGPRLLSFEKGGTRYSLKLLPLGGSCAMLGEDLDDDRPGTFAAAPVWGRISVVAAGPIFNFILAFVLSCVIVGGSGIDPAVVRKVSPGGAEAQAGLQEGDLITEYQGYHIDLSSDLYVYSYLNPMEADKEVRMKVKRDGETFELTFLPNTVQRYLLGFNRTDASSMRVESLIEGYPLEDAGLKAGDVITGINGTDIADGNEYEDYIQEHPLTGDPIEITYERDGLTYETEITPKAYSSVVSGFSYGGIEKVSGLSVLKYGALEVKYMIRTTLLSLKELVTGQLGMKELSGPVGVVDAIGDTYEESKGQGAWVLWMNLMNMAVLLSANLGVMNLLPLPALDGGRLVFLLIEAVRRKPGNRQLEGGIHFAGLMLLMLLMFFIMYQDILKLL